MLNTVSGVLISWVSRGTCLGAVLLGGVSWGCGTKAEGIEGCRKLELARCQSAKTCELIDDVDACERFVTDNCLHGFKTDQTPGEVELQACVRTVEAAASCAKKSGLDSAPDACSNEDVAKANARTVCELIVEPSRAPACDFLQSVDGADPTSDESPDVEPNGGDQSDTTGANTSSSLPDAAVDASDANAG